MGMRSSRWPSSATCRARSSTASRSPIATAAPRCPPRSGPSGPSSSAPRWSSLVALALAIAGCYTFERLLAADAGLATVILLGGPRGRLLYRDTARARRGPPCCRPRSSASGLWLYLPAAEFVIGGKDPGVYMNEGIAIAQRGGVVRARSARRGASRPRPAISSFPRTTPTTTTVFASWGSSSSTPTRARWSASSRTCFPRGSRSGTVSTV